MVKRRFFAIILSAFMTLSLVVSGCSSNNSSNDKTPANEPAEQQAAEEPAQSEQPAEEAKKEPVNLEISWWGGDERSAAISNAIKAFEAKYDWIKVTPTFQGFDGYNEKLIVRLSTNKAPDLFFYSTDIASQIANDDMLVDLGTRADLPYFNEVKDIAKPYMTGDKIYGVPAGVTNPVLVYDKKIFEDAGVEYPTDNETWVSLGEKWKQIHAKLPEVYGTGGWFRTKEVMFLIAKSMGYDAIDMSQKPAVMTLPEDLLKVWEWNEGLWKDGVVTRDESVQTGFEVQNMSTGIAFSSALSSVTETTKNPLGFAPLPKKFDENGKDITSIPSPAMLWGVSAKSPHIDEAIMLLNFLQNDPEGVKAIGLNIGSPPVKASLDIVASTLEAGSVQQQSLDVLKRSQEGGDGYAQPKPPGIAEAENIYLEVLEKYVFKKIDAKQFMTEVQEKINEQFKTSSAALKQ